MITIKARSFIASSVMAAALMVPATSHALFPGTDIAKFGQNLVNMIQEMAESEIMQSLKDAAMEMDKFVSEFKVDSTNNVFGNAIMRTNQARADIHNLEQLENAQASPDACAIQMISVNLEDVLCAQEGIIGRIRSGRQASAPSVVSASLDRSFLPAEQRLASATDNRVDAAKAKQDKLDKVISEYDKKLIEGATALHQSSLAGPVQPGDAAEIKNMLSQHDYALALDSSLMTYKPATMAAVEKRLFVEYPPYISRPGLESTTDREKVEDLRKKLVREIANEAIIKQVAMKAEPAPNQPSKLETIHLLGDLKLDPNGNFMPGDDSYLAHMATVVVGSGPQAREKVLMQALKLNTQVEQYKQMLAVELQLANYALSLLE